MKFLQQGETRSIKDCSLFDKNVNKKTLITQEKTPTKS